MHVGPSLPLDGQRALGAPIVVRNHETIGALRMPRLVPPAFDRVLGRLWTDLAFTLALGREWPSLEIPNEAQPL